MKYRYNMTDMQHLFGATEQEILLLIDDGMIIPEGYTSMSDQRRRENVVSGTFTFTLDSIQVFIRQIYSEHRRFHQMSTAMVRHTESINHMMLQLSRMEEFLVNANTRITLRKFAELSGISLKYIRNSVEPITNFTAIVRISGFQLPLIKEGRNWTISYAEYLSRRRAVSYDILRKAQKQGVRS